MSIRFFFRQGLGHVLPLALVLVNTTALAQVQGIVIEPPGPYKVGDQITLTVDEGDNRYPIVSYQWKMKRVLTNPPCPTLWTHIGSASEARLHGNAPISYHIKLMITYGEIPGDPSPPPGPTEYRYPEALTFAPADGADPRAGFEAPQQNGKGTILVYQVQSGGEDCGGTFTGLAQQRLTNRLDSQGDPIPDLDWWPPVPSSSLLLIGSQIHNEQVAIVPQNDWDQVPIGSPVGSWTQELRILWQDSCNNIHVEYLGSRNIIHRKISDTEWQVDMP